MTTRINLLDWRADRRERRRKEFLGMLVGAVVLALVIAAVGILLMNSAIANQNARNTYLKQQIARLDQQIRQIKDIDKTRQNLLARMNVIQTLQQNRAATVHFFDQIVDTLPDGVYLRSIKQRGDKVTIEGVAQSNGRVSAYMKNLDASDWFADPRLVVIKTSTQDHQSRSTFTLVVKNLTQSGGKSAAKSKDDAKGGGGGAK